MSKRLIGYGYTNANGVATLDYDAEGNELQSSGYVGTGAGEVDISASAVIDGSTFVSEIYEIWDYIFYYDGTTTVPSKLRYANQSITLTPSSNGITITNTHSTNEGYVGIDKEGTSSSVTDWIDWIDFAFEFEMVEPTSGVLFQLRYDHTNAYNYAMTNLVQGDVFKVEYTNGITRAFKNGVQVGTDYQSDVGELTAIRWNVGASKSVTVKNMKLYPI